MSGVLWRCLTEWLIGEGCIFQSAHVIRNERLGELNVSILRTNAIVPRT
jgi:hypothetical protein